MKSSAQVAGSFFRGAVGSRKSEAQSAKYFLFLAEIEEEEEEEAANSISRMRTRAEIKGMKRSSKAHSLV